MNKINGIHSSELNKINEILDLTEEELKSIRKQFSSVYKISENKAMIKDWMDDSIQLVNIK